MTDKHLDEFQLLTIVNVAAMNILYMSLDAHVYTFLDGIYEGHCEVMLCVYSASVDSADFSELYQFTTSSISFLSSSYP